MDQTKVAIHSIQAHNGRQDAVVKVQFHASMGGKGVNVALVETSSHFYFARNFEVSSSKGETSE